MSLKKPNEKIQSSLAGFEFTCKELPYMQTNYKWQWLQKLPDATVQKDGQFDLIVIALQISMFAYHVEVMKQSLHEYKYEFSHRLPSRHSNYLNEICEFLGHLRNALLHAKGELVPRWDIEVNKLGSKREALLEKFMSTGFTANIPATKEPGGYRFSTKLNSFRKINFKIKLTKTIPLDRDFISKLRLLSWYVLTITKKQKISTLCKYLDQTTKVKKKTSYKNNFSYILSTLKPL